MVAGCKFKRACRKGILLKLNPNQTPLPTRRGSGLRLGLSSPVTAGRGSGRGRAPLGGLSVPASTSSRSGSLPVTASGGSESALGGNLTVSNLGLLNLLLLLLSFGVAVEVQIGHDIPLSL